MKPYDDLNFDFENMGIGANAADQFNIDEEIQKFNEEEEYRISQMTPEQKAEYDLKKKLDAEIDAELIKHQEEQISILKESRDADVALGKDKVNKNSGVENSRQRFAKSANAKPFFERMKGDDDKFGGKKRTMRRKNKKGTRMAMARRTRQRKTRTRTRTMRKKARKSRKSKSRKSRK
jgi:hypothetical protein